MKNDVKGFTLIELMIVVIVIAVLAAIAIPAYQNYVERARRADAKSALLALQLAQEKWRANNSAYSTQLITDLGYDDNLSPDEYYALTIDSADASSYQITATPVAGEPQANDTDCAAFTTDEENNQTVSGTASASECWQR